MIHTRQCKQQCAQKPKAVLPFAFVVSILPIKLDRKRLMKPVFYNAALVLAALSFSGSLKAAETPVDKKHIPIEQRIVAAPPKTEVHQITPHKNATDIDAQRRKLREQELSEITENANIIANVLLSELATQATGDPKSALTGYGSLFVKYPKPEIAQRAMELAMLSPDTLNVAEVLYQHWRELTPQETFEQRHMGWQLTALQDKADVAFEQLPQLLADPDASDEDRADIFLFVAQLGSSHPTKAIERVRTVHRLAMQYPDLQEAAVADTLFSAMANKDQDAIAALRRLSANQDNIQPSTLLTLEIMLANAPHILKQFFDQTPTEALPDFWQTLHVEILLRSGKVDEAYRMILNRLDKSPSVELYTQAGYLAAQQDESPKRIQGFFDKAYALGNKQEQSRAALFAAVSALKTQDTRLVEQWVAKIHEGDYAFDQYILKAMLAGENKQWDKLHQYLDKLNALPEQRGQFFNQDQLFGLRTDYVTMALPPQQALDEVTTLLQQENDGGRNAERIAQLHYTRGLLLSDRLERPADALEDLRQYLALNPNDPIAQNALGYTLLSIEGKIDEALNLLKMAYKTNPESPAINDSIGWAYYLQGDAPKALPYLEYAYDKMNEAEIGAHLGEVLWTLKQQDEAKLVWHSAWKKDAQNRVLKKTLEKYRVRFLPK